jgi:hypothetical protein
VGARAGDWRRRARTVERSRGEDGAVKV